MNRVCLTLSLTIHAVRPLLYSLRSLLAPYSRFAAYGVDGNGEGMSDEIRYETDGIREEFSRSFGCNLLDPT